MCTYLKDKKAVCRSRVERKRRHGWVEFESERYIERGGGAEGSGRVEGLEKLKFDVFRGKNMGKRGYWKQITPRCKPNPKV